MYSTTQMLHYTTVCCISDHTHTTLEWHTISVIWYISTSLPTTVKCWETSIKVCESWLRWSILFHYFTFRNSQTSLTVHIHRTDRNIVCMCVCVCAVCAKCFFCNQFWHMYVVLLNFCSTTTIVSYQLTHTLQSIFTVTLPVHGEQLVGNITSPSPGKEDKRFP